MVTFHSTLQKDLNDTQDSPTTDWQLNKAITHYKNTQLLFLSRFLVFKYCFGVLDYAEPRSQVQGGVPQMCPHPLFDFST
jgi:hypothetical protein